VTEQDRSPTPDLLSALVACLDGMVASDAIPEGLMRGEIGWLGGDLSDPNRQSTAPYAIQNRFRVLEMAETARGLMDILAVAQGIPADGALQLRRALDDAIERIGAALRRSQADRIRGLYVIIDPEVTGGRDPLEIARAAINGGARILQLRDKLRDKGEQLPLGAALRDLCAANDALLIINDHADLAAALGPDHVGLHVGQTDLPVAEARKVLAPGQVLGRSNREIDLIIESQHMGADHVAFGAMYTTTTKQVTRAPQGPERLKQARAAAQVPLVAIGGITAANVAPVVEAGADAICVTAAVGSASEPEAAAAALTEAIRDAGGRV
jgi:thiamine-phosphate pyrophosphorylase